MSRTDHAEAFAPAPPDAVWAALTDPAAVASWLPPEGMTAAVEAWEAWPGGRLRLVLSYRDASAAPGKTTAGTDAVTGRFLEAEAPWRLAWATTFDGAAQGFAGEMTMAWTLTPEGAGTRIALEARDVPAGIRPEDHAAGMGATLRGLARAAAFRR